LTQGKCYGHGTVYHDYSSFGVIITVSYLHSLFVPSRVGNAT